MGLRLKDLPPEMQAKVAKQLGLPKEQSITTYHLCAMVGKKFVHLKSTDVNALETIFQPWKDKNPFCPCSFYAETTEVN